ncbi:MAG: hypothetical protein IPJ85_14675 [Flavobacteriales bacterium]|nr:hypothetical protein [Flavobacteriales bacterium]
MQARRTACHQISSTGTQHGPGPYEFNAVGYSHTQIELADACSWFSYYDISVNGAQTGSFVTINYTDGTGCPGSFGFTVPAAIALQQPQPLNITGSCTNGNLGSAWVSVGMGERIVRLKNSLGQYVQGPGIFCSAYPVNADGTVQFTSLAPGNYWVIVDTTISTSTHPVIPTQPRLPRFNRTGDTRPGHHRWPQSAGRVSWTTPTAP